MRASGLRALAGGIERDVTIDTEGGVTIDGTQYAVEAIGPGAWRVSDDHRATIVHAACDEDGCSVHVDGHVYRVEIARIGPVQGARPTPANTRSPLRCQPRSCQCWRVLVRP